MIDREKAINDFEAWCIDMDEDCPVVCLNALAILKEQDKLLHKKQKDIDKLCADISELKHRFHEKTEIVRCKDCKWFDMPRFGETGFCRNIEIIRWTMDYCSDGERNG